MSEKLYLYPVWTRIWHWTNALLFILLILTGLSMQYVGMKNIFMRFDLAVSLHNIGGVVLTLAFLYFVIANLITKNQKYYSCHISGCVLRARKQLMYYLFGVFKKEEAPFPINKDRKFNPLQKVTYVAAMYILMPILIISGLALLYPEVIIFNIFGISGIHLTDLVHVSSGFLLSIFMIIHIYFCTFGKTAFSNFKGMINGYH